MTATALIDPRPTVDLRPSTNDYEIPEYYNPETMPGIVTCRSCGAVVLPLESGGACPQCRTPIGGGTDETRLAGEAAILPGSGSGSGSGSGPGSSSAGWLSSSGAIDHGRFQPGTLLGGRYRVVERLGCGGMGEVYRPTI